MATVSDLPLDCLLTTLMCSSSTLGSDCLALGSSSTVSPSVSALSSGRVHL